MAEIEPEITVSVWNSDRVLRFGHTDDLNSWLDQEEIRWSEFKPPQHPRLARVLRAQRDFLGSLRGQSNSSAPRNDIDAAFAGVRAGTVLVSECPGFPVIAHVAAQDGDAGMLGVVSSRSDGSGLAQQYGITPDLSVRFSILAGPLSFLSKATAVEDVAGDLVRLKNQYDSAISAQRTSATELTGEAASAKSTFSKDQGARTVAWDELVENIKTDWRKLKAVYDTELGLRAPTTYWTSRAESHRNQAVGFGAAFAASVGLFIFVFSRLGLPYLVAVPNGASPVIAILPVIIPAFVGIWILRILGRQLSESVQLMRDARERETLVKTFLALMKEDVAGSAVVENEDRVLILHALFRASSVTAADDSPPVNWLEAIARRGRGG